MRDFYLVDYKIGKDGKRSDVRPDEPPDSEFTYFEGNRDANLREKWGIAHTAYWHYKPDRPKYENIVDEIVFNNMLGKSS